MKAARGVGRGGAGRIAALAVCAGVLAAEAGAGPVSPLGISAHSFAIDHGARTVAFEIVFDREPDFFTTDAAGRQFDSFQYFVDCDGDLFTGFPIDGLGIDAIVRGEEINFGEGLPIRDVEGPGGERSGGWGPIRDTVPFTLDGPVFGFNVGFDALGYSGQGLFYYTLQTYRYGGIHDSAAFIPLPQAAALAGGAFLLIAAFQRRRSL